MISLSDDHEPLLIMGTIRITRGLMAYPRLTLRMIPGARMLDPTTLRLTNYLFVA